MTTGDDDVEEPNHRTMDMEEFLGESDGSDAGDGRSTDVADEDGDAPLDYEYEYHPPADGSLGDRRDPSAERRRRIERIERAASRVLEVTKKYGNASLPPLDPDDDEVRTRGWRIDEDGAWADPSAAMEEIVNAREEIAKAWADGGDEREEDGGGGDGARRNESRKPGIISNRPTNGKDDSSKAAAWHHSGSAESAMEELPLTDEEGGRFEAAHMEWATHAFAEELDALRTGRLESRTSAKKRKKNAGPAVELDPNQHSFVATPRNQGGGEEESMVAEEVDVRVLADMLRSGGILLSNTEKRMLFHARERATTTRNHDGFNNGLSLQEQRKREIGFK